MNKYKMLGRNVLLQSIGQFSTKILMFLMVPFYTTMLTTAEFGTIEFVNTTITLLLPLLTITISEALVRFTLAAEKNKNQVFSTAFSIALLGIVFFLLISPFLIRIEVLMSIYPHMLFLYVGKTMYEILISFAIGLNKFYVVSTAGILNTVTVISLNLLLLLHYEMGIRGYLLSYILSNIISVLYIASKIRISNYWTNPWRIKWELVREMVQYSIPMIPNSLGWWINNSADRYMLSYFKGIGEVGLLAGAYKIPSVLYVVTSIFASAWRVSSVENFGSSESKRFYNQIYSGFSIVLLFLAWILMVFSKEICSLILKKDFFQAWNLVPLLILAFLFQAKSSFLGSIYTASRKTKMLFISTIAGAVLNLGLNYLLIPSLGSLGAVIATLLSFYTIYIVRCVDSQKIIKLELRMLQNNCCYFILMIVAVVVCIEYRHKWIISVLGICLIAILQNPSIKYSMFILNELKEKRK